MCGGGGDDVVSGIVGGIEKTRRGLQGGIDKTVDNIQGGLRKTFGMNPLGQVVLQETVTEAGKKVVERVKSKQEADAQKKRSDKMRGELRGGQRKSLVGASTGSGSARRSMSGIGSATSKYYKPIGK